jgi:hypothetical protein
MPAPIAASKAKSQTDGVVAKQRGIQQQQDVRDGSDSKEKSAFTEPVQAGAVEYPAGELPGQHLEEPGIQADMQLQPQFMAPAYRGSGKREGMTALITGGDSGIGRAVAVLFAREGADVAIAYLNEESSCIINTGSVTGLEGSARLLDYSATKGAIHAFTKSLASNLIDKGIRVNAIAPGPLWTPLNPADSPPEVVKDLGARTDMKRPAQPEELSPAYVFLASPACASYITGIVLPITGSISG